MTCLLYTGDNLQGLQEHVPGGSVDLIYLDPPFNSSHSFRARLGGRKTDRLPAFEDTWRWDARAAAVYSDAVQAGPAAAVLQALSPLLGESPMLAYLTMMAPRLAELRRVLKPTGSLYLHVDSGSSHYLKVAADAIFGAGCFRNELIWHYGGRGAKAIARQFPRNHDTILFYVRDPAAYTFRRQFVRRCFAPADARQRGLRQDTDGRWFKTAPRGDYTDESVEQLERQGRIHRTRTGGVRVKYYLETVGEKIAEDVLVGDTWLDIPDAMHMGRERLGYPTQKPVALLERIIQASSQPGDTVLDPFCGCGAALLAAQRLGRRWIGMDCSALAIALVKNRLRDDGIPPSGYPTRGEPRNPTEARALAAADSLAFRWWALGMLGAWPCEDSNLPGIHGHLPDRGHNRSRGMSSTLVSVVSEPLTPTVVECWRQVLATRANSTLLAVLSGLNDQAVCTAHPLTPDTLGPDIRKASIEELFEAPRCPGSS